MAPFAILAGMIVALALLPVLTHYTVRTANVYDIFQNFASYGLVALALGITIIAGEFDLSVSSMYLLGGMVAVLTGAGSPLLGILAALGTAVIVGAVQGGLISGFRLNSMPVTLGGYLVVLGITYILGHSKSVLYENYTVGLRLDEPILQIFSIRSLVADRDLRRRRARAPVPARRQGHPRDRRRPARGTRGRRPGRPAPRRRVRRSRRSARRCPARCSATASPPRARRTSASTC